jgi:hypothetical protein
MARACASGPSFSRQKGPHVKEIQFPCWRYNATEPAVIVNDPEELAALGEGWADTPAAFAPTEDEKPKGKAKGKAKE